MKIKCPICVKWNDVDFKTHEFTDDELANHIYYIHNDTPQLEFIKMYVNVIFRIREKIEETFGSVLENEK